MRVRLRGINSKRKRLADGTWKTYYWAWKGGPPLRGELGTAEFIASYNEAVAKKVTPPTGKLLSVLQQYQDSEDFLSLAPRSRSDYVGKIKIIEKNFGDFPLSGMTDKRTRGIFKAWREKLALSSRRQADYAWVVLARILSWGMDRGLVAANLCQGRSAPSRIACREDLDCCRRGRISRTCAIAHASAVDAGTMERATPRRSAAPAVVGL
jgi:hypothetical protein